MPAFTKKSLFVGLLLYLQHHAESFVGSSILYQRPMKKLNIFQKRSQVSDYLESSSCRVHQVDHIARGSDIMINPLVDEANFHESYFVRDGEAILKRTMINFLDSTSTKSEAFLHAGPRRNIRINPKKVIAAVVTCGGICPGINTVIRELVSCLEVQYGTQTIWGIPYGYEGIYDGFQKTGNADSGWIRLNAKVVDKINTQGGSFLGMSRGGHDTRKIIDALVMAGVNMLFVVGGDGTLRGGSVLADEVKKRGLQISIVGVPKTVDNDIPLIDKSFGFESAVEEAQRAIKSGEIEARSLRNGVGIVQLMGRNSGFVALHSSLGSGNVDCVLIPEINFVLEGQGGLFSYIEKRLKEKGHVLVVVAEGAGQEHIAKENGSGHTKRDASGNPVLDEVGAWLSTKVASHFRNHSSSIKPTIKYINPTYMIRSVRANAADSIFCTSLAHDAVHGAFAGFTNFIPGPINSNIAYVPLSLLFGSINVVAVNDEIWARAIFSTGQPDFDHSETLKCTDSGEECTAFGGRTVQRSLIDSA